MLNTFINKIKLTANKFLKNEKGDTNFVSILIIMGIAIALAGVFIGFKNQIVGMVQDAINGLKFG